VNSYRANLKRKYPDCWKWISLARRIPGQLTENEASSLFYLARIRTPPVDPVIVELAPWRGQTSFLLAAGLFGKSRPRLNSIQRAGVDAGNPNQDIFHRNLQRCRLGHILDTTAGHARDAASNWKDSIDILFITAAPGDDTVHIDLSVWSPFVKLGGLVVLHAVSPELTAIGSSLASPRYGDFRRVDGLIWAVKQRPATISIASAAAGIDSIAGTGRLRYLLNRSTEAMLHLNTIPIVLEHKAPYVDARDQHLEDCTEIAIARLQDYVRRSSKEFAENRHAIQALRRSWSWRLTAPLRLGIEILQAIAGLATSLLHGSPKDRIRGLTQWLLFGRQLRASGLLDERYYRETHPDAGWAQTSPLLHFLVRGEGEGKNPNELFDVEYYLGRYPDVARSGVNPLIHYLRDGAYEGRDPHPYFDSSFYLDQNPDVREGHINPLAHFLAPGVAEGRDPNPWFDTTEYLEQNPDVATFGLNPLVHQAEAWSNQRLCSQP
jgi:hypothetical protein